MNESEYLINADGSIFPLSEYGARVTGLGNIPVEYATIRGYGQHGVSVVNYALQPRTLTLSFAVHGRSRTELLALRQALLETLSPDGGDLIYRRVLPDGSRRDIVCRVDASLSVEDHFKGRSAQVGLALFCPDPTFYDPKEYAADFVTVAADAFVTPFYAPDEFWTSGGTTLGVTVHNPGNWRAYPIIELHGDYQRAALHNVTTGALLVLGVAAGASDTVVVDFRPGERMVTRNGEAALDEVESGNMVDWYLAPGENVLQMLGGGFSASTSARLTFHPRYLGL